MLGGRKKIKKITISVVIITLLVMSAVCIFAFSDAPVKYNDNPDLSKKVVGSMNNDFICGFRAEVMEVLLDGVDLIVEGEIISDGVTKEKYFPLGDKTAEEKFNGLFPGKGLPSYDVACYQVKVTDVIYGNLDTDTIELQQLGSAESDVGETKVKKGRRMIMILRKDSVDENAYSSVDFEDGLFEVDKNNKLFSLSDNMLTAKYDGLDAGILKKDIKKTLKKIK